MTQHIAEIDLMDAARDVTGAKKTLLAAIVLAILIAILWANFGRKSYTAEAELVPAESSAQDGVDSSLGRLSGAADLLGVNLAPTGDTDFIKYKELLGSERLAGALFQNTALRPIFFPSAWDAQKRDWNRPSGIGTALYWAVSGLTGRPAWSPPESFDVQKYLQAKLVILTDKITGYFKVSIEEDSPQKATALLQAVIATADGIMRQSVKNRALARIAYLNATLASTTQEDQRSTIINLMSQQEKVLMLSSADRSYAVDVIDPPAADPSPTSPKFLRLLAIFVFLAVFLVSAWAVLRGSFVVRRGRGTASLDDAVRAWVLRRAANGFKRPRTAHS